MPSRHFRRTLTAAMLAGTLAHQSPATAQGFPARVRAVYDITFNGIGVGSFEFNSATDAKSYTVGGSGKVSVLLGAFKWEAMGDAKGALAGQEPKPGAFAFSLKGSSRSGTTRIAFDGGKVTKVDIDPVPKPKPDAIPVKPEHLEGAIDPLAAVMALTKGGANPCARRVPVYEGQKRIDIVLSPLGNVPLTLAAADGHPATGIKCRINYKFISGHRPGDENTYINRNQQIEMVLRPVPAANVYVPYEFSASTLLGTIRVRAKEVSLELDNRQRIVLAR